MIKAVIKSVKKDFLNTIDPVEFEIEFSDTKKKSILKKFVLYPEDYQRDGAPRIYLIIDKLIKEEKKNIENKQHLEYELEKMIGQEK